MAEALLGELSHLSRVVFPADFNQAAAVTEQLYQTHGQFWTLVVPKADSLPDLFTPEEARRAVADGGVELDWASHEPERARIILTAVGAYQLVELLAASRRLTERDVAHRVAYLLEPGRFRAPRSEGEKAHQAVPALCERLFPSHIQPRLFITHTRPEVLLGVLGPLHTGPRTSGLGYINQGGTLNTSGMFFINRCSWAHVLAETARLVNLPREHVLSQEERDALDGRRSPHGVIIQELMD